MQHPHPDQLNSITAPKVLHPQLPPYNPSIPPPQITSTPYRVNDLECWLLQIEKAQYFTNLPHYDIALWKSIDTPYKQLSRVDRSRPWESIKKMLQEAHAPYPVKLSTIMNMFRKQKPDETL